MGDVLGEGSYAKVKEAIDSKTLVRFYIDFICLSITGYLVDTESS